MDNEVEIDTRKIMPNKVFYKEKRKNKYRLLLKKMLHKKDSINQEKLYQKLEKLKK